MRTGNALNPAEEDVSYLGLSLSVLTTAQICLFCLPELTGTQAATAEQNGGSARSAVEQDRSHSVR
jgi:hypothetical protein